MVYSVVVPLCYICNLVYSVLEMVNNGVFCTFFRKFVLKSVHDYCSYDHLYITN
jgi:hypothetical protein